MLPTQTAPEPRQKTVGRQILKVQNAPLTRTKRQTLELLGEYFCLRTKDVAELLKNRLPSENDLRGTLAKLKILREEGYVHRERYFELDVEARTYVYGLTDKGVKVVDTEDAKSFDEHSLRTLDHELEISFFHIALNRFCEQNGLTLYWQQSDLKRGIHPDALFALTNDKGTYYFFLEIEKTKKTESALIKKLARYAEYYDTDQCEKDWGFRKFRVIIVQKNDVRRQNLLRELHGKLPHKMFWLTIDPLYKKNIGGEIFRTPADPEKGRYSFLLL